MCTNTIWYFSRRVLIAACALLAAAPLMAGDSRWYIEGKLGEASAAAEFGPEILGWFVDGEDAKESVEIGYEMHRNLAVQAGYHDLGTYTGQPRPCPPGVICPATLVPFHPREVDFKAFSLVVVPQVALTERVAVYGKLGMLEWDSDVAWFAGSQGPDPSERDLLAGIGARYVFPKGLGVLLEYEDADFLRAASVGASWRF